MAEINQIKIDLLINTANAAESIGAQKKAIRDLLSEMGQIDQGSDAFRRLSQAAGELQDQMSDTRSQAKFFADDMKNLSGLAAVGRGIAGGFAVLQGTMGLLSGESEELQKAMQKVQITMGIIQGIQEVATLLNKDETASIFLKNIANKLFNRTKQEQVVTEVAANTTTATGTIVNNANTGSVVAATTATRIWNAVLRMNPIVLIITALAALAVGIYSFITATDKAKAANDAYNKTLEYQNELYKISRERQEADIDARIRLAESEGKSAKDMLALALEKSNTEETNDANELKRLQKQIDFKKKQRTNAFMDSKDETANAINEEIKATQKQVDIIEKKFEFQAGVGNKYYVDRKILQNKYDDQSVKDTQTTNKKISDAQTKAQADLLAKRKEFAAKMLETDQYIKDQQIQINTNDINAIENKYAKELALLEDANKKKAAELVKQNDTEISTLKTAIQTRYGLNTAAYNAQLSATGVSGIQIAQMNANLQTQLKQNEAAGLKERNETLKRFEEERLLILQQTTKAIISPEEFTRFTEYINDEINKVPPPFKFWNIETKKWQEAAYEASDAAKELMKSFKTSGEIEELNDGIENTKSKIQEAETNLKKLKEGIKLTGEEFQLIPPVEREDESGQTTEESLSRSISKLKGELAGLETTLKNDVAYKTSEEGLKRLTRGYIEMSQEVVDASGRTEEFMNNTPFSNIVENIKNGGEDVSKAIDDFSKSVYGKVPEVLKDLFTMDEMSQQDSLQKTKEYNVKIASLYLDKYKVISDITKGVPVEEFTVPKDNSVEELTKVKANTDKLKAALDLRYNTLKKAAQQAYEDELFAEYQKYSKGEITAEQYGKNLEHIKQKNTDNLLDIELAYGNLSQEQLASAEQKKIATIKAALDKEKAIRTRSNDVWIQTTQATINEINKILQGLYQEDINRVGSAYDYKRSILEQEKADYEFAQSEHTVAEMQKLAKDAEFRLRKDELDKEQAAAERSIKIKQFNAQKATDAIQIGINTTMAISKTVAELGGVGALTPAGIALLAGLFVQGAAAATFVLSQQPAFASGGLVVGEGGPKDDKISARLSNGESVINARSTAMYKPILSAINQAGGGVAFPMANGGIATPEMITGDGGSDMREFKQLLYDIASRPIETYVKEASVTNAQTSISRQNRRTSF